MKYAVTSLLAAVALLAANSLAEIMVTSPITSSHWRPNQEVRITWENDSASKASGKLAFELMDGTDRFHMVSIKDIKKDVNASDKLLTWTVPEDIPTSNNLSIRVTDEEGNQNYSSTFSGGGAPVKPKSGDQKKSEKDSASAHKDDKDYKSDKSDKSASKDKGSKKSKQSKHSASESASASETKSEHNSSSAEGTTAARAAEETGDAGEVKLSWVAMAGAILGVTAVANSF